jgi:hypothetical protein
MIMGGSEVVYEPVDPAQVGRESLQTQIDLAPDVYRSEAEYRPKYAQLDQRILADTLTGTAGAPGLLELYGTATTELGRQQAAANTAQREADIADVERLGGRAVQAWKDANPELQAAMGGLQASLDRDKQAAAGRSPLADSAIQQELQKQALGELQAGGSLSAEGRRLAQQTARTAAADRGMVFSNQAIFDEALNSEALRQQRQDRAVGMGLAVDASGQQAALLDQQLSGDMFSREMSLAQLYSAQSADPYQLVLGQSRAPALAQAAAGSAGYTQGSGPGIFDPYNSSLMGIYSGNAANSLAAQTANANNSAASGAGMMGLVGTLGAAAIIACWLARAVYGGLNPRWLLFRRHLFRRAPRWLFELYIERGRDAAERARRDPALRARTREIMDRILAKSGECRS